jgi:hypothetical protein
MARGGKRVGVRVERYDRSAVSRQPDAEVGRNLYRLEPFYLSMQGMADRPCAAVAGRQDQRGARIMSNTYTKALGGLLLAAALSAGPANAEQPKTLALLTSHLQNDHEEYEPTTDAERARMTKIMQIFKDELEQSGKYNFVQINPDVQSRIDKDQAMGSCGGCEIRYGMELGAEQVAWIDVQKVSNLILNINVYIKDVKTGKLYFVKSVDIRGNTDESWEHSMRYLIKHYMLQPKT